MLDYNSQESESERERKEGEYYCHVYTTKMVCIMVTDLVNGEMLKFCIR